MRLRPPVLLAVAAVVALMPRSVPAEPPTPGVSPQVQAVLDGIRKADTGMLAISAEDGRFLRVMAAANHTQHALEIGSASGYSGIWIGLGLRETGGHLVTIEYDKARATQAAANIARAGLSDIVQVVSGDAFKEIPKIEGQFDFVFLDAWKRDYKRFLDLVTPRMPAGALFLAHNVINKGTEMPEFLHAIETDPNLFTTIVAPAGEGVSVSWKRH
jgi:predicted O-methyltransferase YrrM